MKFSTQTDTAMADLLFNTRMHLGLSMLARLKGFEFNNRFETRNDVGVK